MSSSPKKRADQVPATPAMPEAAPAPAAAPEITAAPVRPVRKSKSALAVETTVARHQKELAEALEMAQAIKYEPVTVDPAGKAKKADKHDKPAKPRKPKLVRDSYAMPEAEYSRIAELKKRLAGLGHDAKKSELLRAGIAQLATLDDRALLAVVQRVERIKTGRPPRK